MNNFSYLPLLQNINQKIRSSLDMNATLAFVLSETCQALEISRGLLLRLKYRNPIYHNQDDGTIPPIRVEVTLDWLKNQGIIENKELSAYELSDSPLSIYAWQQSPQVVSFSSAKAIRETIFGKQKANNFPFSEKDIESLLIIPLLGNYTNKEDKLVTLGFFLFYHHQPREWQSAEIEMVKGVALQASLSIIHQQTLNKVQSLVDERTAQLRVSLEVKAKLSEKMRHHIEELKRVNKIKDQFIANLSDALRNPLANIKMAVKMLKLKGSNPENQRYLHILETECEKEINLVNNLLTLQQLKANEFPVESEKVHLDPIFQEFKDNLSEEWTTKKLNLKFNNQLGYIYTDAVSLQLILKELIQNAVKFSHPDNDITVNVYSENEQNILKVINVSGKISKKEQEQIFKPFYQNKENTEISNTGTGLGLALVKSLVENLNGTITIDNIAYPNNNDYLTTFTITLPHP